MSIEMNYETKYSLELVLEDGAVFVGEDEISGKDGDTLKALIQREGREFKSWMLLEITCAASVYRTPYDPGLTYGPPEKCYPPEGGDFDLESLIHKPTGIDLLPHLSADAVATLEVKIQDASEQDEDEARGEYLYELRRDRNAD